MRKGKRIRVVIVDDHRVVRIGLKTVLADAENIELVGEAAGVESGAQELLEARPEVALIDIRLSDGSGLELCRRIKAAQPEIKILMLSSYVDDNLVLEAISAGADGYLLKEVEDQDIAGAITAVASGGVVMDPTVTRKVLGQMKSGGARAKAQSEGFPQLSYQERRVLELVSKGTTNREIGIELKLAEKTVRNYLSNVFGKLQLTRRSEAAAWYARQMRAAGSPPGA